MEADFVLVMGGKNISSWSMRPWLVMKHFGIPFQEVHVPLSPLTASEWTCRAKLAKHSPSGWVPVLRHGSLVIWESLAICEYIAELFADRKLWPVDRATRAVARAVSSEMHAGFASLRHAMPLNVSASVPTPEVDSDVRNDINRVCAIWSECRTRFGAGGSFLFGDFSIADAMFAPVVTRFRTYGVKLDRSVADYADAIWGLPAMQEWCAGAGDAQARDEQ